MLQKFEANAGTIKEIYFVCIIFTTNLFMGSSRAYLAFLFYQLSLPGSSISLDDEQKSIIAAFGSLCGPLGCLLSGVFMDVLGRKRTVLLIYLPITFSWLSISFAKSAYMLYGAFLAQGFAAGMTFCISTYISEICRTKYRGSLFVILMINYSLGNVISNYLMYLLEWHIVARIYAILAAFIFVLACFLPESPLWLYVKGDKDKSIKTLCSIRNKSREKLESEIQDLENFCSITRKSSPIETLRNCINGWRQLLILMFLFLGALSTGYVCFTSYGIIVLNCLDIPYDSEQVMIVYSFIGVIACFLTPYVMHKYERRIILMATSSSMGVSLLAIILYKTLLTRYSTYTWIVPVSFYLYSFSSNMGPLLLASTMAGELLPNESRGVLSGIHGSVGFLYIAIHQKIFPSVLSAIGIVPTIGIFSTFSFLLALYSIFILPETKDKTLNEIQQEYFSKKKRLHNFA